jgi:hypothetical protein
MINLVLHPVFSGTQEAEAEGSFESRSARPYIKKKKHKFGSSISAKKGNKAEYRTKLAFSILCIVF